MYSARTGGSSEYCVFINRIINVVTMIATIHFSLHHLKIDIDIDDDNLRITLITMMMIREVIKKGPFTRPLLLGLSATPPP